MSALPLALCLTGPTAGGKSAVAMALAARLPVEIVSVDSAQVFRGMDIGTAKPGPAERAAVAHHLIDRVSPEQHYSAARFRTEALTAMQDIVARGRLPLLVGGTLLYLKALREGLSELPAADPALRAQIDADAARDGWPALHARLARLDPQAGARVRASDPTRIQRALEIVLLTGAPLAAAYAKRAPAGLPFRLVTLALVPADRATLHARIAQRFEAMLAAGLVEELAALRRQYRLHAELPAMRCVGYRQAWAYLDGEIDAATLRATGIAATRQLAKRQLTWLRSMADVETVDGLAGDAAARIERAARRALDAG